jgi:hypothetical protein
MQNINQVDFAVEFDELFRPTQDATTVMSDYSRLRQVSF